MATILIIEDNEDNLAIFSMILEHYGHKVVEARDGQTGIAAARLHIPDIILMDISMPVMNGWEATKMLKSYPLTARIPVVAVTAHAMRSDEEKANEIGFDMFVRKPVEPKTVLEIVQRFVGAPRAEQDG